MRPDIVPGAVFPDYEFSDHHGVHRTLSELQEGDPLVLVLSRGGFCPKERRQHEGLLRGIHRPEHNPMIPHTIVLEPGLRVCKIYNGYWFFGRPTVEELRLDLRAVLQRCRPDWDISSAEQRAAWAKGEKAGFHPYGKTRAQVFADQD